MDNKELYQKLNAAKYIGRNGILSIEIERNREHLLSNDFCYRICIDGVRGRYTQVHLCEELDSMPEDILEQVLYNMYLEYVDSIANYKEENK